ncbi:MAG: Rpn family recombination-promoting nuclease/putative transposase [Alphaproteobacteria bacterium]
MIGNDDQVTCGPARCILQADFASLFGDIPEALRPYLPAILFALVDLARIGDDTLSSHIRLRSFLKTLKYILRADLPDRMAVILAEASALEVQDVVLILTYIGHGPVPVGEEEVRSILHRVVPDREEEIMASFGRRYYEEGKARGFTEGRTEGKTELLLHLLRLRFGALGSEIEARIRNASEGQVDEWCTRFVTARELVEVFAQNTPH